MNIEKNKVVRFHYCVQESESSAIIDESTAVYLHGHDNILPKLEAALAGHGEGDSLEITLSPIDAYGEYVTKPAERVSMKQIMMPGQKPVRRKLTKGSLVEVNTEQGVIEATVVKAGLKFVHIDTNHPLAGKTLDFSLKVEEIRDASPEEIKHGHVHGEGGHHH